MSAFVADRSDLPLATVTRPEAAIDVPRGRDWSDRYRRFLLVLDLLVLIAAFVVAEAWKFGFETADAPTATARGLVSVPYVVAGATIVAGWWLSLQTHRTHSRHVLGEGVEEYRRVLRASVTAVGVFAIVALAFKIDMSREYLAIAFPLGTVGLLAGRKTARWHLHRRRLRGACQASVLIVGTPEAAATAIETMRRDGAGGYEAVGVWTSTNTSATEVHGRPVFSQGIQLEEVIARLQPETVMVIHAGMLGAERLNQLAWDLVGTGTELVISPAVLGVAESRLHLRTVSSMAFLHLEEPRYEGASRFAKWLFDVVGASVMLVLFSPLMLLTATLVKTTSKGPVFYTQERVGKDGRPFRMIKFRSMRQGADRELAALLAAQGASLSQLPKVDDDPRVTPVGRFIRRYSIDELPQLFNVVKGDMSLVGPRPQREFEVAGYDEIAHRRLAVRPGVTGLWQVSGRSDLTFEEAIRLDIFYVENWSLTSDVVILWKTIRAVFVTAGAY